MRSFHDIATMQDSSIGLYRVTVHIIYFVTECPVIYSKTPYT